MRWLALGICLVSVHNAQAKGVTTMAGDYICKSDCHRSDAPPSIEVNGTTASCRSDLGGVFYGRVLSDTEISCFNMVDILSGWKDHRVE